MLSMMSVMAIVADEDCRMSVSTVPKARKMSTEPKPWADHDCTNASTSGVSPRSGTDSFMNDKPRNRRQKPTMSSLMLRRWLRFELESRKPTAMSGTARMEMSALKPSHDTSHAVTVVPMLAPMMTPMAWASVSRPALTKLTTITVVAEEDCITEVMPSPVSTPLRGFDVMAERKLRMRSPAAFCRPELIRFIP